MRLIQKMRLRAPAPTLSFQHNRGLRSCKENRIQNSPGTLTTTRRYGETAVAQGSDTIRARWTRPRPPSLFPADGSPLSTPLPIVAAIGRAM
jgi:hypothetical protein